MLRPTVRLAARRALPALRGLPVSPQAAPLTGMVAGRALSSTAEPTSSRDLQQPHLIAELERLETQIPSWQTALLRLAGTFSDAQWQGAAGGDMYMNILQQLGEHADGIVERAALPDRFYTHFQLRGLHCWLAHVRLREEPKESYAILYRELMEHVWYQVELDLTRQFGFGYIEMSKHLKSTQYSWHGLCRHLDEAMTQAAPRDAMAEVLVRNMYVDDEGELLADASGEPLAESRQGALELADYLLAQRAHLASLPAEDVLKGRLTWCPVTIDSPTQQI